jgi:hypothetical protein
VRSLNASGSTTVFDAGVTSASIILVDYVHGGGNTPLTIVSQTDGSFVVNGSNNKDFIYVVFNKQ